MLAVIRHSVQSVYNGWMGGDFVDVLASLMRGQLTQAFQQAWEDDGNTSFMLPDFLQIALDALIIQLVNFDYIYQYYKDIVDARVDGASVDPLLARAELWANRYNEAYSQAVALIASKTGGKLIWILGGTEEHCPTCAALNGIVAYASEWDLAGVHPQSAPNGALECGGWRCDCSCPPTTQRRTRNAFDRIMSARL
jgi:hypothetical protein